MPWTAPDGSTYIFAWEDDEAGGTPLSAANLRTDDSGIESFAVAVAQSLDTYLENLISTGYAPLASPALTGAPTAPTATQNDNSTKIANTAYADRAAASVRGLAIGSTGVTAATRFVGATTSGAPASGTFLKGDWIIDQTGTIWVCTTAGSPGTWLNIIAALATLASPALSGNPTAPTQTALTNNTRIATTAYADGADTTVKASATTTVFHGSTASTARPTGWGHVIWVGSVQPTNIDTANDVWIDTSS